MENFQSLLAEGALRRGEGVRGRYAPSPTGAQHLGNARTALVAWMQARLQNGVFVMRMEDLDLPRVQPGSAAQILSELEWMGIDWDEGQGVGGVCAPYRQSERNDLYAAALELFDDNGLVFKCVCSRKDIRMAASAPHGKTPKYPGTCRLETPDSHDRPYAWRFRVPNETIGFDDAIAARATQNVETEVGDFVLKRSDGLYAYQLAVVVDDALMGISDVVRGMDLIESTPRQILLFDALGVPPPTFWHVPLMRDGDGRRMSKRFGSTTIESFRAGRGNARQLVGELAASLGLVEPGASLTPRDLLSMYDIETFRRHMQRVCARECISQVSRSLP